MIKNHLIIILFNLPWEWSTDFTNQTAYILSKKNTVICYMWSEAFSIKEYLKKGKIPKIFIRYSKNLYLFYPLYIIPFRRFEFILTLNLNLNIFLLKILVKYFEITKNVKKKIVWIFYPNLLKIYENLGNKYFLIYDGVDFFEDSGITEKDKILISKNERELTKEANLVTAISTVLQKHLQKYRKDVYLVPQGFRLQDFQKKKYPQIRIKVLRPIIGYVGAINHRIDYKLLLSLAKRNKNWNFVLCGPLLEQEILTLNTKKLMSNLLSLPNVLLYPSQPKNKIPSVIKQFDIAMIPYDISQDFNKYCYPMKLFEYFYMGKPVVSTPIEELKRFPKFVKIGKNAKEWEKHIKNLLSKPWPKEHQKEQRKLAIENSWEKKIDKISSIIKFQN